MYHLNCICSVEIKTRLNSKQGTTPKLFYGKIALLSCIKQSVQNVRTLSSKYIFFALTRCSYTNPSGLESPELFQSNPWLCSFKYLSRTKLLFFCFVVKFRCTAFGRIYFKSFGGKWWENLLLFMPETFEKVKLYESK